MTAPTADADTVAASTWAALTADVTGAVGPNAVRTVVLSAPIDDPAIGTPQLAVPVGAHVTLDLHGFNLTIDNAPGGKAGVLLPPGAFLTVENTTATPATLTSKGGAATAGGAGAGIGGDGGAALGDSGGDSGVLTLLSGAIDATGGVVASGVAGAGAGVGGGGGAPATSTSTLPGHGGTNGTVVVGGGTLTAHGGSVNNGTGGAGAGVGGGGGGAAPVGAPTNSGGSSGGSGGDVNVVGTGVLNGTGGNVISGGTPPGGAGAGVGGGGGGGGQGDENSFIFGGRGGEGATVTVTAAATITGTGGANPIGGGGAGIGGGGGALPQYSGFGFGNGGFGGTTYAAPGATVTSTDNAGNSTQRLNGSPNFAVPFQAPLLDVAITDTVGNHPTAGASYTYLLFPGIDAGGAPEGSASTMTLSLSLPAGVTAGVATGNNWNCTNSSPQLVTCAWVGPVSMDPGQLPPVSVPVTLAPGTPMGTNLAATATFASGDAAPVNATDPATSTATGGAVQGPPGPQGPRGPEGPPGRDFRPHHHRHHHRFHDYAVTPPTTSGPGQVSMGNDGSAAHSNNDPS